MPAMKVSKYKSDNGSIHPIRLRPDTLTAVAGTVPEGDVTNPLYVHISKSKRQFGLAPRKVLIARTLGTDPNTYTEYASLPVCDSEDFNLATGAWQIGANVTYKGATWKIVTRTAESGR